MNRIAVAKELVKLAKSLMAAPKSIDDLSAKEQWIAKGMMEKGYRYLLQITTIDGDFGAPLYFKSPSDVGPLLRSFPDYKKAKVAWTITL
jgi:hypothetical protein